MKTPIFDFRDAPLQNLIINGGMEFWQRGTSLNPVTNATNTFLADRFLIYESLSTGAIRADRDSDTPDTSVPYGIKLECTTAQASPGVAEMCVFKQRIEGNIFRKIRGKKARLNFYTKSNYAGTAAVGVRNAAANRSWSTTISVSGDEVWQKHSIFFEHNEDGAWLYDNGIGLRLHICLAAGSNLLGGNNGEWVNGSFQAPSTGGFDYNLLGAIGRYIKISKVWMHEGWDDIPYEAMQRDYASELQLCQRYYEKSYALSVDPGTIGDVFGTYFTQKSGVSNFLGTIYYKVRKRALAIAIPRSTTTGTPNTIEQNGISINAAADEGGESSFLFKTIAAAQDQAAYRFHWTADAEL